MSVRRSPRKSAKIAVDLAHAWGLIANGTDPVDAAEVCGFGRRLYMLHPLPRPEPQIRSDLARQLEGIEQKFRRWVNA